MHKLQKLLGHFRFWIKFFFYSAIVLLSAMTVLYLRLKQGRA